MALVLTVPQDTNLQLSLNNGGSVPVDPVDSSTLLSLPPGSYRYQPLVWDDSVLPAGAWVPTPFAVNAQIFGSELGGSARFQGDTGVTVQALAGAALFQSNSNAIPKAAYSADNDGANGFIAVQVNADDNNNYFLLLGDASGGIPKLGFLGATAVARQSITGVTEPDQINSIVAALVALGLVTDNR